LSRWEPWLKCFVICFGIVRWDCEARTNCHPVVKNPTAFLDLLAKLLVANWNVLGRRVRGLRILGDTYIICTRLKL